MSSTVMQNNEIGLSGLRNVWKRLVEPSSDITDITERRQARLLSATLLGFVLLGIFTLFTAPIFMGGTLSVFPLFTVFLVAIPYMLSRTRHYQIASYILLILVTVGILQPAIVGTTATRNTTLYFLVIPLLLASLLFDKRQALIVMVVETAILFVIPLVDRTMPNLTGNVIMMVVSGGMLYIFLNHRDALEQDRQAELKEALTRAEAAKVAMETKNFELAKANAIIKENARLKSEFLATMSHELRTPLNAIRGFTTIMLEGMGGEIDEEADHMLKRIDANGIRLLGLINDVLDIAKIEAGRMELVDEAIEVRNLVEQWQAQMSVLAEQKGISLEVNVAADLPQTLQGDSQRLTQIATNLLSNAFKFTKEGKVKLDVEAAGENWVIRVTDSGIGIPPHALNFIFEEFRQVDGSSKREFGGTGLGLAIVRNLCRTMGGSIQVSSQLGEGSVFTVTLPLVSAAQPELAVA